MFQILMLGVIIQFTEALQSSNPNVSINIGPVLPKAKNDQSKSRLAYRLGNVDHNFNLASFPCLSCTPNNLTLYQALGYQEKSTLTQLFHLPVSITNMGSNNIIFYNANVSNYYKTQNESVSVILNNNQNTTLNHDESMQFNIIHKCPALLTEENYWSIISLQIYFNELNTIQLQYQFICDVNYHPSRFDWSSFVMVLFSSIFILGLARFGTIYSFKLIIRTKPKEEQNFGTISDDNLFQGFFLGWIQAFIYFCLIILGTILSYYSQVKAEIIEMQVIFGLVTLLTAHFFNEVLCLITRVKWLKKRILFKIRVCDIFSIILAVLSVFIYIFCNKPWFVSDFLSICLMGSLIKLFKLTSIKSSIQFILPLIIINVITSIYLAIFVRYEWDNVAMRYFNTPLSVQIPLFEYVYKKKCGWISVLDIVLPGFFLGYAYRFDKCKLTSVYEIVSFVGLLIGFSLWLVAQYGLTVPLPVSIFTIIPMIGLCALIAMQRNELRPFWTGIFYDEVLFNPFKDQLDLLEGSTLSIKMCSVCSYRIFMYQGGSNKKRGDEDEFQQQQDDDELHKSEKLVLESVSGNLRLDQNLFQGLVVQQQIHQPPNQQSQIQAAQSSQVQAGQQQQRYPYTNQPNQTSMQMGQFNQSPSAQQDQQIQPMPLVQNPAQIKYNQQNQARPLFPPQY